MRFDALPPGKADPSLAIKLDEWENTWFPVAEATLRRRFPKVHEQVFLNLSQTEGPAVVVSVGTFVERVLALRDGNAEGKQARQLLAERGLDDSVLGEARTVLKEIGKPAPEPPPPDLEAQREEAYLAENELWSWYLEWSQIARGVVTDRGLLRQLGFLRSGRSDSGEDDDSDLEGETATAGPPLASAATA